MGEKLGREMEYERVRSMGTDSRILVHTAGLVMRSMLGMGRQPEETGGGLDTTTK
jgi:hypothetical protein